MFIHRSQFRVHCRSRGCIVFVFIALLAGGNTSYLQAETRRWNSSNGRFSVLAELVQDLDDRVMLRSADGRLIDVPLRSLSTSDRQFIRSERQARSGPAMPPDQYGEAIDLMPHVNVDNPIHGTWQRDGETLVTGDELRTQVMVDYEMPRQYELQMEVQIAEGTNSICIALPMGQDVALVMVDSFNGQWTGINYVNGRPIRSNATTYRGRIIDDNERHELVCAVHERHIKLTLDGETIFDWFGHPKGLSYHDKYWSEDDFPDNRLVLASWTSVWKFHRLQMRPILSTSVDEITLGARNQAVERSIALIETETGSGSGFVAGRNLVATNHHVIEGATIDEIRVYIGGESQSRPVSRILASSQRDDLAILEVQTDSKPLPIAWDGVVPKGQPVSIYGNPSIDGGVLLRGASVSGTVQSRLRIDRQDYLQIAANINPGSSGGPVLNASGQVAGVIVMKATDEGEKMFRDAVRRFDPGTGPTVASQRGVALAVPGQILAQILDRVSQTTNHEVRIASNHHNVSAVVDRSLQVAGCDFLRLLGNTSPRIFTQARIAQRRNPSEDSLLPPVDVCAQVRVLTQSDRFQSDLKKLRSGADEKLNSLLSSNLAGLATQELLKDLSGQLQKLRRLADHPPTSLARYEKSIADIVDRLQELSSSIREKLREDVTL